MVERQLRKLDVPRLEWANELGHAHDAFFTRAGCRLTVRSTDRVPDGRHLCEQLAHTGQKIDRLAAVNVTVRGEQHHRLDLAEAIEHPLHAEIRRARGPDRADAGGREHGDHGGRHVRQVAGDTISGHDASTAQRLSELRHFVVQLAIRETRAHLFFAPEHERRALVAPSQQILGEIEARIRKPTCARHPMLVNQRSFARGLGDHPAEGPYGTPECLGLTD